MIKVAALAALLLVTAPVRAESSEGLAPQDSSAVLATPAPTREARRASQEITPHNLLRIEADFGHFEGYALLIRPEGLDGLRSDRHSEALQDPPSGLVGWDRIDQLEKRGGSSGRGALLGAMGFGFLGGLAGAATVSVDLDSGAHSGEDPGPAFVKGALAGGLFGAVLGGLIGAAIPSWHVVYRRPARP